MWIVEEELRKIDQEIYAKIEKVFSLELNLSLTGGTEAG